MPFMNYSGSPTPIAEGSLLIDATGSDRVTCPIVSVVNKTQMWIAFRIQPAWANTEAPEHTFFRFGPDTNNELFLQYASVLLSVGRDDPVGGNNTQITTPAFAAGDTLTFIGTWTSTTVGVSYNGSVFSTAANTRNPDTSTATLWDIGQRGYSATGFVNADVFWVATGLATLTDANAATIHGLANTGIGLQSFPVAPAFFWAGSNQQFYAPVAAYWVAA